MERDGAPWVYFDNMLICSSNYRCHLIFTKRPVAVSCWSYYKRNVPKCPFSPVHCLSLSPIILPSIFLPFISMCFILLSLTASRTFIFLHLTFPICDLRILSFYITSLLSLRKIPFSPPQPAQLSVSLGWSVQQGRVTFLGCLLHMVHIPASLLRGAPLLTTGPAGPVHVWDLNWNSELKVHAEPKTTFHLALCPYTQAAVLCMSVPSGSTSGSVWSFTFLLQKITFPVGRHAKYNMCFTYAYGAGLVYLKQPF